MGTSDGLGWAVQRRASARGHKPTPQGEALVSRSLWKNYFPLPPGRSVLVRVTSVPGASVFIHPSNGDMLKCGFSGQGLEGSLHSRLFLCPKIRTQRPAFPKSRGEASASVLARAWQPPRLCSRRDGVLSSRQILIQFLSHINGTIWGSPGRPGNAR